MDSPADFPKITAALMQRGYSAEDCRKILGGNILRVFREVEQVGKQLRPKTVPASRQAALRQTAEIARTLTSINVRMVIAQQILVNSAPAQNQIAAFAAVCAIISSSIVGVPLFMPGKNWS